MSSDINDTLASDSDVADLLEAEASTEEHEQVEAVQTEQDKKLKSKADEAYQVAATGVQMVATAAERKWPVLEYDDKTKHQVAEKTALVLAKYDMQLPPWLIAWKEEIELGMLIGSIAAGSYIEVQKYKKSEAEKAKKDSEGGEHGAESQQQPIQ